MASDEIDPQVRADLAQQVRDGFITQKEADRILKQIIARNGRGGK